MPSLEESYLEYISTKIFPGNVRPLRYYWTFIGRFSRDNYPFTNTEIVKGLLQRKDVIKDLSEGVLNKDSKGVTKFEEHFEVNLSNVIDKICSAFSDEVERGEKNRGRTKSNIESPWNFIYNWLWEIKYDRWLQDHIWKIWKQEAHKNTNWMQFHKLAKGIMLREPEKSIPLETPLSLKINLDRSGNYLILFNRGTVDSQQNKTQVLFTPSQAFAPSYQLLDKITLLPLPESSQPDFQFDTVGTEEFIGIVIDRALDLDWLKSPDNPALKWEGKHLEQVWEKLQQTDPCSWKVFYRDFNVV